MSTVPITAFKRSYTAMLAARLGEPRRFLQVVAGPPGMRIGFIP